MAMAQLKTTTFTTTYTITGKTKSLHNIPIGKPISNTSVYILDENLRPVPIGVPGELYTGGDGVAVGYLNKDDLTKKKFILNPIAEYKNEILYRTGDNARWMADGNIDYIGRSDNQIKISGFRIEIEGIISCLLHCPGVQQCCINIVEDDKNIKNLVAYVVSNKKIDSDTIKTYLADKLPFYMIPRVFVFVEQLPLTTNGKIDYSKLPSPIVNIDMCTKILPKTQIQKKTTEYLGKTI